MSWGATAVARHAMTITLFKMLVATVPVCILLFVTVVLFFRRKTLGSLLQLLGAGCLIIVVLTHFCEALHLIASMHWGDGHSVGHYLDLGSAILGLTLLSLGYLLRTSSNSSKYLMPLSSRDRE